MGRGLLVAAFDFSTAHTDEFHDWYDLEHIPERQAVPGFGACERWMGDEQPTLSVATYDLNSVDVLRSKAYASIAYGNLSVWSKHAAELQCQLDGRKPAGRQEAGHDGWAGGELRTVQEGLRDQSRLAGSPLSLRESEFSPVLTTWLVKSPLS